ncbi:GntR family transcriptional regulator [Sulfobacillus harzensis]|uniref:GntR family transcriptional regulator n=1 Tax=Sulfobacillus harzensis TaxID=2729629 RepID=A0A7Y0Q0T6_9FIRM|nr:GntR family transcriptional regulator [Sulfobacillus harzensis]NMP21378.1 GntR family transcriptional regulator [Sulfobacillus harzensis]
MNIRPRLLNQQILEHLKQNIFDQRFSPGEKLAIDLLAREYGCGISVVRESLFQLASERLVEYHPNRGFRVSPLLQGVEVEELFNVRRLLEPAAARVLAGKITPAQTGQLRDTWRIMRQSRRTPLYQDYKDFQEADARFHDLVFAFAGNSTLRRLYASLHVHLHMARFYVARKVVDVEPASEEHRTIIERLESGDAEGAAEAMDRHISASYFRYQPLFQSDVDA